MIAFAAPKPRRPTGFVLFAHEDDRWTLTAFGYAGHHPPTDADGFLSFLGGVAPPDVLAAIRAAEPLDDIVGFRFPADVRRRDERLRRFPAGLLVFGDALCSSNPSFALGMSSAALQAVALRDVARRRRPCAGPAVLPGRRQPVEHARQLRWEPT